MVLDTCFHCLVGNDLVDELEKCYCADGCSVEDNNSVHGSWVDDD